MWNVAFFSEVPLNPSKMTEFSCLIKCRNTLQARDLRRFLMRFTVTLFLAVIFLVGCINYSTTGISIDNSNQNVVLGNDVLKETLTFGDANTHIQGNRVVAQVIVTNRIRDDQKIEYRFNWYDLQGLEVDNAKSPWRQCIIYSGASIRLEEKALSSNAIKFRVSLRSADISAKKRAN